MENNDDIGVLSITEVNLRKFMRFIYLNLVVFLFTFKCKPALILPINYAL